jgi:hypothetical protein
MAAIPDAVPVTKMMTHGDPAEALLVEAERGDWDLVVVGQASRRHRIPFQRPVGERLRDISIPVLVVHAEPEPDSGKKVARRRLWSRKPDNALERLPTQMPVE